VEVGHHVSIAGSYRPPVFKYGVPVALPPQTIISAPVHTAVCRFLGLGAVPPDETGSHASWAGTYLAPRFVPDDVDVFPPHAIISVPAQMARWSHKAMDTPVEVGVQVFETGS
jgi:hypothetical protein